jgi:hypothetical protein
MEAIDWATLGVASLVVLWVWLVVRDHRRAEREFWEQMDAMAADARRWEHDA